jgi:hypothetical protein
MSLWIDHIPFVKYFDPRVKRNFPVFTGEMAWVKAG